MSQISSVSHSAGNMDKFLLLLLAITATEGRTIKESRCEVSIDYRKGDLEEPQPLILTDSEEPTFVFPNENKTLVFAEDDSVIIACPGENNGLAAFGLEPFIRAVCLGGKDFLVDSEVHEFSELKCKLPSRETVRKSLETCEGDNQVYEIGFYFREAFLPLMQICRDDKELATLYTRAHVVQELKGFQSYYPRPSWKYGRHYPGYNMNSIYKLKSQMSSVETLLGSKDLAEKYLRSNSSQFLNRGHLTAKADFVFGAHQSATFWLLNAMPQWASFNQGNWMELENSVRDFAITRRVDLVVYTGVHGQTTLEDANGQRQPLFLHANRTHRAFPVPRYFWKVIHEPVSNRAVAFVGLNEPYAAEITADMYLCPDISLAADFSWLAWQPDDIYRGVSYVCSVEELRKAVPTVPCLGEVGVLF